ncbi:hypothetical protein AB0P21_21655 [Kribbella sp. NPDC056861]|uniref:hypothetical protein n=1 Tax=Kribbella sp. NPDC056861 TaxID=3154857 RepID=UPI003413DA7F
MAQIWIDSKTHWKASGKVQPDGSMTGATVIDNHGTDRTRGVTFKSKQDFISWIKQRTK